MSATTFSDHTCQQAAAFDQIGAQYETVFGHNPAQISAIHWLTARLAPGEPVLDIGCGTGVPAARMFSDARLKVSGIDISATMLKLAQRNVPDGDFRQLDVLQMDFAAGQFAAVCAFFSLLMLPRREMVPALQRIHASLKPGGWLLLSMVEGDVDWLAIPFIGQTIHVSAYSAPALRELLEQQGFSVLQQFSQPFRPDGASDAEAETQLFFYCQKTVD